MSGASNFMLLALSGAARNYAFCHGWSFRCNQLAPHCGAWMA